MDKLKYPVRKRNRLEKYDYSSAGYYFITICTKNKEKLFCEIIDGDELHLPMIRYSKIGQIIDQQIHTINRVPHVRVEKYVIMPNHIHMIISVADFGFPDHLPENAVIPHTIGGFKRMCNQKLGKDIFQRTYYDNIIRSKRRFDIIWRYMEDNPRRWKEDVLYVE